MSRAEKIVDEIHKCEEQFVNEFLGMCNDDMDLDVDVMVELLNDLGESTRIDMLLEFFREFKKTTYVESIIYEKIPYILSQIHKFIIITPEDFIWKHIELTREQVTDYDIETVLTKYPLLLEIGEEWFGI